MKKKLPTLIVLTVVILVVGIGVIIWQKSQVKPTPPPASTTLTVKKVDLASQPAWVQALSVTVARGRSANGLDNVTLTISGIPSGLVDTLGYVITYQTSNHGTQGFFSSEPVKIAGATTFRRTLDFGTCSTKSCVRYDGVTSLDLELDFQTTANEQPTWSKTLSL